MADYFSETFACMSIAYAAAHAEEPAEPGPMYEDLVDNGSNPLPISLSGLLELPQEAFEAYVRGTVLDIIKTEAAEVYEPEETDLTNPYSVVNNGDVWRMVEKDSVDFYRNGGAIGESRLVPIVNAEDAVSVEGGRRSLNQDAMNAAVADRLATPAGGYERAFEKDAQLGRIIQEYVKAHPSEEFTGQHYRELIARVKMEAAETEAERRRAELIEYVRTCLPGLDIALGGSSASSASSSA